MSRGGSAAHIARRAPELEERIRALDQERRGRSASRSRLKLINLFGRSYLPATGEGVSLVIRLGRFLEDHAEEIGEDLPHDLAPRLDPRPQTNLEKEHHQ